MTPPKCLPWERTTVRKRGQKRALSLRYPFQNRKINQNNKKHEKVTKSWKVKKWQKSTKSENAKSDKTEKCKKWKSDKIKSDEKWQKKCEKVTPPQKPQNVT